MEEAVNNLISQYATNIDTNTTEDIEGLIQSIIKANSNLTESVNNNNWELIGGDIQKLQELIDSLEKKLDDEDKNDKDINNTDKKNTVKENNQIIENNIVE